MAKECTNTAEKKLASAWQAFSCHQLHCLQMGFVDACSGSTKRHPAGQSFLKMKLDNMTCFQIESKKFSLCPAGRQSQARHPEVKLNEA